ncbi:hypothetical protein FOA52_000209 [Chlamydomonas sp. UWO 241]|nr:hypothetical protein FOA52_000209 [Chlamydomonas sp. UWO 241]
MAASPPELLRHLHAFTTALEASASRHQHHSRATFGTWKPVQSIRATLQRKFKDVPAPYWGLLALAAKLNVDRRSVIGEFVFDGNNCHLLGGYLDRASASMLVSTDEGGVSDEEVAAWSFSWWVGGVRGGAALPAVTALPMDHLDNFKRWWGGTRHLVRPNAAKASLDRRLGFHGAEGGAGMQPPPGTDDGGGPGPPTPAKAPRQAQQQSPQQAQQQQAQQQQQQQAQQQQQQQPQQQQQQVEQEQQEQQPSPGAGAVGNSAPPTPAKAPQQCSHN